MPAGNRNRSLEGVRAVAALLVFAVHAGSVSGFTQRHGAGAFLARMDVGVSIFFVVSGYLLYRPHARAAMEGRRPPGLLSYLRRRAVRIIPAYWVALALIPIVLGTVVIDSVADVVVFGGFAQIYDRNRVFGGIVPAWSLCTELSFYLALPAAAALVRRVGGRHPGVHVTFVALAYAASVLWRIWLRAADPPFADLGSIWLFGTADLFALGILLAVIEVGRAHDDRLATADRWLRRLAPASWPAAGVVFVAVSLGLDIPRNFEPTTTAQDLLLQAGYGVIGVLMVIGATFGRVDGALRRILASPAAVWAGTISYGFYVWHVDILERTAQFVDAGPAGMSPVGLVLLALPVATAVAAASWYLVERPAQRWRGSSLPRDGRRAAVSGAEAS